MTEPNPLVDPVHVQDAHLVQAATHQPQRTASLFKRLVKSPTGLFSLVVLEEWLRAAGTAPAPRERSRAADLSAAAVS